MSRKVEVDATHITNKRYQQDKASSSDDFQRGLNHLAVISSI